MQEMCRGKYIQLNSVLKIVWSILRFFPLKDHIIIEMTPAFETIIKAICCILVLLLMIGYICWICGIVHASGDMAERQPPVPIIVYTHHPEDGVIDEMGNPIFPNTLTPRRPVLEPGNLSTTARLNTV